MGAFEYRQAEEIRDTFARHEVRYLFIGKSAAILLGFPDTTQDADIFAEPKLVGIIKKGLILPDGFTLVVKDGPAAAHPTRIGMG